MAESASKLVGDGAPMSANGEWHTVGSQLSDHVGDDDQTGVERIGIQSIVDEIFRPKDALTSRISDILIKDRSHNGTIMTDADVAYVFRVIEQHGLRPENIIGINHLLKRQLIGCGSTEEIDIDDHARQNAQLVAFRIAQKLTGDALTWKEKQKSGQELPEYAEVLVDDKKELVFLYLHQALSELSEAIDDGWIGSDDVLEYERLFRKQIDKVREYAMFGAADNSAQSTKLRKTLEVYSGRKGNLGPLIDKGGRYKDTSFEQMIAYIETVSELSSEQIIEANDLLGIVNFGRYSANQIIEMLKIMKQNLGDGSKNIENTEFRTVSVVLSGRTGDHNGAFSTGIRDLDSSCVLAFEVEAEADIQKVVWSLRFQKLKPNRITVLGHGDFRGIVISNSYSFINKLANSKNVSVIENIARSTAGSPINDLVEDMEVDEGGFRVVNLNSCLQGARNWRGKKSMAESLSNIHHDTTFRADVGLGVPIGLEEIELDHGVLGLDIAKTSLMKYMSRGGLLGRIAKGLWEREHPITDHLAYKISVVKDNTIVTAHLGKRLKPSGNTLEVISK